MRQDFQQKLREIKTALENLAIIHEALCEARLESTKGKEAPEIIENYLSEDTGNSIAKDEIDCRLAPVIYRLQEYNWDLEKVFELAANPTKYLMDLVDDNTNETWKYSTSVDEILKVKK